MAISSPKNSRDKRLHLVFFTDASKTKSTSISIKSLIIIVTSIVCFFATASLSLYLYKANENLIAQKDEYIRELKSSIAAFAVTNEKTQLLMSNETDPQSELTRKVAVEILSFPATDLKLQVSGKEDDTLANLQSSLSSLSSVNANLARNEKQNAQTIDFRKNNGQAKPEGNSGTNEKTMAARDLNATTPSATNSTPALTGVQVEQRHLTEINGQTTVHFQLVNTRRGRNQSWMGRVCGVAELSSASNGGKNLINQPGLIAIPSGQPVPSAQNPTNSCADGELVRFSRLRPTELVVPARQDAIKRVTIFFVEAGSNRTMTQRLEF